MILLLADPGDVAVDTALPYLRARGADAVAVDVSRFLRDLTATMTWGPNGHAQHRVSVDGRSIELASVTAVWHRHACVVRPREITDARIRAFAVGEAEAAMHQIWSQLSAMFVPAPWEVILAAQRKLHQLQLASALGFEIPPSIVTTDPKALLEFVRAHGHCITKHIAHRSTAELDTEFMRFTEPVTVRDLAAYRTARLAPVFAQAYVPKRVELRVTVVGDQVFAAEVASQAAARTRHDYRRLDHNHARYSVHALPSIEADRCRAIARALGLRYGALDLVLTPDGRYVFLEINPRGEYLWIEDLTKLPITRAICELLVDTARGVADAS
jgi:glutathione synthase/RimK-type ligase-like ATP-grasp enzyme